MFCLWAIHLKENIREYVWYKIKYNIGINCVRKYKLLLAEIVK